MIKHDSTLPLISAIMPTMGKRRRFVAQAIQLFDRQDYPNKELLVVDEHDVYGNNAAYVPSWTRYVWLQADTQLSIGAKRNLACSLAQGDILCQWDDDDYYGPQRLSTQVQPILDGDADVTALRMDLLLDTRDGTLWHCSDDIHQSLFPFDVRCGSLMYKASYFHEGCSYSNGKGEDIRFLHNLLLRGARLRQVRAPEQYVCVRHGGNTTEDIDGMDGPGWEQQTMEQYFSGETLAFYTALQKERV